MSKNPLLSFVPVPDHTFMTYIQLARVSFFTCSKYLIDFHNLSNWNLFLTLFLWLIYLFTYFCMVRCVFYLLPFYVLFFVQIGRRLVYTTVDIS